MKKAWRWNNKPFKRSSLDSMLDKVVRDLLLNGGRPKHRGTGAVRSPAKRHAKAMRWSCWSHGCCCRRSRVFSTAAC